MMRYIRLFLTGIWIGIRFIGQFLYGSYVLLRYNKRIVTIFGGKGVVGPEYYYADAERIGYICAKRGFLLLTGGGPGIMEAVHRGACQVKDKGITAVGVRIEGIDTNFIPLCNYPTVTVSYFFTRKMLLHRYSHYIIVLPGGIGTIDELFHVMNLMKVAHRQRVLVYFLDSTYWGPLLDWMREVAVKHGFIDASIFDLLLLCDTVDELLSNIH